MAETGWPAVTRPQDADYGLSTTGTKTSVHSTSAAATEVFNASPLFARNNTNKLVSAQTGMPPDSRLSSTTSNLHQLLAANSPIVPTSRTSPHLSSDKFVDAQPRVSAYGQCMTKAYSQQKPANQPRTGNAPTPSHQLFVAKAEPFASNSSASLLSVQSSSPPLLDKNPLSASSTVSTSSPEKVPVVKSGFSVSSSRPSPEKRCADAGRLVHFLTTDKASTSSFTGFDSAPLPDALLSPSPGSFWADSPSSMCDSGSPDTTDSVIMEMDSGFSDNVVDKSSSPDQPQQQQPTSDPSNASPSKRKRVRKSRAKVHDPHQKIVIKKTRRVRANDRERTRMHGLNDAMDELRKHIPSDGSAGKMTKIDTLRTAANYIRVLKMMLGEIDKGEDLTHWPSDMVAAVNSLYVQPAASPDSTGLVSPAPPLLCDDRRMQPTCNLATPPGAAATPPAGVLASSGGGMVSGHYPGYQTCGLAPDNYHGTAMVMGANHNDGVNVLNMTQPMPGANLGGHGVADEGLCQRLGGGVSGSGVGVYGSSPVNSSALAGGYGANMNSNFGVGNVFSQQYSVSNHPSSAQNIFQQSSQCY